MQTQKEYGKMIWRYLEEGGKGQFWASTHTDHIIPGDMDIEERCFISGRFVA